MDTSHRQPQGRNNNMHQLCECPREQPATIPCLQGEENELNTSWWFLGEWLHISASALLWYSVQIMKYALVSLVFILYFHICFSQEQLPAWVTVVGVIQWYLRHISRTTSSSMHRGARMANTFCCFMMAIHLMLECQSLNGPENTKLF